MPRRNPPVSRHGPVVDGLDFRDFLMTQYGWSAGQAAAARDSAYRELLHRTPVVAICAKCDRQRGTKASHCQCRASAGASLVLWRILIPSLCRTTPTQLEKLTPLQRERILAWRNHLRQTGVCP